MIDGSNVAAFCLFSSDIFVFLPSFLFVLAQCLQRLDSVRVVGVQFDGAFVVFDRQLPVAVGLISFAETVVDVGRLWVIGDVQFEDLDGVFDPLWRLTGHSRFCSSDFR